MVEAEDLDVSLCSFYTCFMFVEIQLTFFLQMRRTSLRLIPFQNSFSTQRFVLYEIICIEISRIFGATDMEEVWHNFILVGAREILYNTQNTSIPGFTGDFDTSLFQIKNLDWKCLSETAIGGLDPLLLCKVVAMLHVKTSPLQT